MTKVPAKAAEESILWMFGPAACFAVALGVLLPPMRLDGLSATVILVLSQCGGKPGTPAVLLFFTALFAWYSPARGRARCKEMLLPLGLLGFGLLSMAVVNEYALKSRLAIPRPSHRIMFSAGLIEDISGFYALSKSERQTYLAKAFEAHGDRLGSLKLSPAIRHHWIEEAGFSFPSGHTLNAFTLSSFLFAWALFRLPKRNRRAFILLPGFACMVAVTRVMLRVHTPLDVGVASGLGIVAGFFLFRLGRRLAAGFLDRPGAVS